MPNHRIHIKLAQDVNKYLKLDNDSLMLGSVLPDLSVKKEHELSHFQYMDNRPNNFSNAKKFVKSNHNTKDDISIGYAIHLLTDKYYNNWYYNIYSKKCGIGNREDKQNLFFTYDEYILKHYKLNKFYDLNIIEKLPIYPNISFDKEYIKEYITKYNNDIDNQCIDYSYSINDIKVLEELYKSCLENILEELREIYK